MYVSIYIIFVLVSFEESQQNDGLIAAIAVLAVIIAMMVLGLVCNVVFKKRYVVIDL